LEDLKIPASGEELKETALPAGGLEIIEDLTFLLNQKSWYAEHRVPWKRGYLLYGAPGNGKTKFIRGLAKKFDLPVFLFDLSTLTNHMFRDGWKKARLRSPCLVVLEDIDSIFHLRTNRIKKSTLTFDCILNTMDGVEESDGIILAITTNNPETLDPALGGSGDKTKNIQTRPGRIDRALEMPPPSAEGRYLIISRIFRNIEDEVVIQDFVKKTENLSGAQVQEYAIDQAIKRLWKFI